MKVKGFCTIAKGQIFNREDTDLSEFTAKIFTNSNVSKAKLIKELHNHFDDIEETVIDESVIFEETTKCEFISVAEMMNCEDTDVNYTYVW